MGTLENGFCVARYRPRYYFSLLLREGKFFSEKKISFRLISSLKKKKIIIKLSKHLINIIELPGISCSNIYSNKERRGENTHTRARTLGLLWVSKTNRVSSYLQLLPEMRGGLIFFPDTVGRPRFSLSFIILWERQLTMISIVPQTPTRVLGFLKRH